MVEDPLDGADEYERASLLADVLVELDRPEDALDVVKGAFRQGVIRAALRAAAILADELERRDEVEVWYRKSLEAGDLEALIPLAETYEGLDDLDGARMALEKASDAGVENSKLALANFLADYPEFDIVHEAEDLYRRSLEDGDDGASFYYALSLHDQGRVDEAIPAYQQAIEDGSEMAHNNIGRLSSGMGDHANAERYLRQGVDAGLVEAIVNYSGLLAAQGRNAEIGPLIARARSLDAGTGEMAKLIILANGLT